MPDQQPLWGGETAKAVKNFPISGDKAVSVIPLARARSENSRPWRSPRPTMVADPASACLLGRAFAQTFHTLTPRRRGPIDIWATYSRARYAGRGGRGGRVVRNVCANARPQGGTRRCRISNHRGRGDPPRPSRIFRLRASQRITDTGTVSPEIGKFSTALAVSPPHNGCLSGIGVPLGSGVRANVSHNPTRGLPRPA